MHQLYVLFENASGYALFRTSEFEEIGAFIPQVRNSILDVSKFRRIVTLLSFFPFKNANFALENMKCISEGRLHLDLQLFLESNVPRSKKSFQSVVLGVQDEILAASIKETLNIECTTSGPLKEIIRGIRTHFPKLVSSYKNVNGINKSQLSLGHNYCRTKLNFSATKFDGMIPQNVVMLDQLNKDINTLTARVRQWYSFHFPELTKLVPDTEQYVKCVDAIGDRASTPEDLDVTLQSILNDVNAVQLILKAISCSMGMEIASEDVEQIQDFCEQIISLISRRNEVSDYLNVKMNGIAPNLSKLMGEEIGARLISQAGSLIKLSKLPSSTVQVLGAEKSLFRTLKTKGVKNKSFPGLNKKASVIGKAYKSMRVHRMLASKCCLAARIDCFSAKPNSSHGSLLKQEIEDRIECYEKCHQAKMKNK